MTCDNCGNKIINKNKYLGFSIIVIMSLIKINNKTKKECASLLFSCISLILIVSIFIGLF